MVKHASPPSQQGIQRGVSLLDNNRGHCSEDIALCDFCLMRLLIRYPPTKELSVKIIGEQLPIVRNNHMLLLKIVFSI